jgi:aldose 1-epimerase
VRDVAWSRAGDGGGLEAPLPAPWPAGGRIRMEVAVRPGELELRLSALAGDTAMPVALGWHPWFRRVVDGATATLRVPDDALVQERDADGVPTGGWASPAGGWNDGVRTGPVEVAYPGRGALRMSWDAPFAILFDEHPQGVCVEPTTSPAESMAHVVGPGERLDLTIAVRWSAAPDAS